MISPTTCVVFSLLALSACDSETSAPSSPAGVAQGTSSDKTVDSQAARHDEASVELPAIPDSASAQNQADTASSIDVPLPVDAFSSQDARVFDEGFTLLTPAEYRDAIRVSDGFVVNVHIPYEGEIEGTDAFVPFNDVEKHAAGLPQDKTAPLFIYCRSGRMSAEAFQSLKRMGYRRVVDLKGGMIAWKAAGYPIIYRNSPDQ